MLVAAQGSASVHIWRNLITRNFLIFDAHSRTRANYRALQSFLHRPHARKEERRDEMSNDLPDLGSHHRRRDTGCAA
jgi:hypothetical protein